MDTRLGARLREIAQGGEPGCLWIAADLAAWEKAEGPGSAAAMAAVARRDAERWIPGLPARRTYKVLGRVVVVAVLIDAAMAWLSPSAAIDTLDAILRYGTAGVGLAVALWSLLSEVRGWEGSDAATWFLKARVDRYDRTLEARRRVLAEILVAVGPKGLVIWREGDGHVSREAFAPDAILGLSLDVEANHMVLCLTAVAGVRRFDWLPRDLAFEAAVARLAGMVRAREAMGASAIV